MKNELNNISLSKKLKVEEERRKKMKTTSEYIEWLERFTKTHNSFNDKSFDYKKEILVEDLKKVKLLSTFYSIISDWAEKNYIEGEMPNYWTFFYNIKYNNILYEIGLNIGQGGINWVSRIEKPNSEVINFEEIMSDNKRLKTTLVENALEEFSKYIIKLRQSGISEQAIRYECEKSLDECVETKVIQKILK